MLRRIVLPFCIILSATQVLADEDVFSGKVASILESRCVSCHNDDDPKGGLSLQSFDGLLAGGEGGAVVEAGNVDASSLLDYISGDQPEMPKDDAPLTADDVDAIRQWIAEGAGWPEGVRLKNRSLADLDWWSLKPLASAELPKAATHGNPIDWFVSQGHAERGLAFSEEASRQVLIRRLTYDLTGLPPSPEAVAEFVASEDPEAYSRLVEQLLESPQYGERWARHWLDVVHYGETHGYDKDKLRMNAWPYRDYVIRAFNDDRPYSRFVKEQLAGDVLWPETTDGIVATGFIAAGPWDFIGHAEVPEEKLDGRVARNLDRDNMVTNTMNTFCSLTIQCARCHNHKLDPVTMRQYYSLQAVFAAVDRADRSYDADPQVAKRRAELSHHRTELVAKQEQLSAAVEAKKTPEIHGLETQIAELTTQAADGLPQPEGARSGRYGYHSQVAADQNTEKWVQVDLGESKPIHHVLIFASDEYGWSDFGFPHRFKIEASEEPEFTDPQLIADHRDADFPRPGSRPSVFSADAATGRYLRVTATKLWSRRQKGQPESNDWIFALGELVVVSNDQIAGITDVDALDSIEALPRWGKDDLHDGIFSTHDATSTLAAFTGKPDEAKDHTTWPGTLLAMAPSPDARAELDAAIKRRDELIAEAAGKELLSQIGRNDASLKDVDRQIGALPPQSMVYAGTVHNGQGAFRGRYGLGPREIFILHRGDVAQPGEPVRPGTVPLIRNAPSDFPLPDEHDEGFRRLALADWIVRSDNPLTWRSIVNRVWHYHFGQGLVDTPNDFGRGGSLPTHPELLDWLAVEFRDGGNWLEQQSIKSLHRLICNSRTYRQSSLSNGSFAEIDSGNQFLWRMKRRRLSAEEIHDTTLVAARRLDLTPGGPSYQDFVIERPEHSPHYEYDLYDPYDSKTHRRAIYRFIVRSQPQPFMDTLNCADPSMSVPKRDETLTALQALGMMNNRFMVAMSELFAARLEAEGGEVRQQLSLGYELVTGRKATDDVLTALLEYNAKHGLKNTCRVLFNLNEFVFVD